jgi:hypothetical protein
VPEEYRQNITDDIKLFYFIQDHSNESWAKHINDDLGYKLHGRNKIAIMETIIYQARLQRIHMNNNIDVWGIQKRNEMIYLPAHEDKEHLRAHEPDCDKGQC